MCPFCINIHETAKRIGVHNFSYDNVPSPGAFRKVNSPVTHVYKKEKKKQSKEMKRKKEIIVQ
jgi:adenylyl- and sulfurtransferase ThiI